MQAILITGMMMIKLVFTSTLLIMMLGCSSSPIKSEDKMDLTKYENQIKQACLEGGEYAKHSEKDQNTLCTNNAERAMVVSERYFWLYQEDNVLKNCKELQGKAFSDCAIAYQGKHYDATTAKYLKNKK
ncbi:MAG: hypothetical protein V7765_16655 [Oleispira sp.]